MDLRNAFEQVEAIPIGRVHRGNEQEAAALDGRRELPWLSHHLVAADSIDNVGRPHVHPADGLGDASSVVFEDVDSRGQAKG